MFYRILAVVLIFSFVAAKLYVDTVQADKDRGIVREYNIFKLQQETREAVRKKGRGRVAAPSKKGSINYPDGYKGMRY
ncbi:MAG: hypothetical protein KAJ73_00765 [Zetaproteobacteria bacterium]|nr:hypothetical protein [Zetaproteobacteria bacterium]